jgi:hypothetical protein
MTGGRSYGSPGAFRRALTDKPRDLATRSRWTLQQPQRQMAYDRLPQRSRSTWRQFPRIQVPVPLACVFLHVDCGGHLAPDAHVLRDRGGHPVRPCFRNDRAPAGIWTSRQARILLMDLQERAGRFRFPIRDRAGQFAGTFDAVPSSTGSRWSRSAAKSFGERVRRTLGAHGPGRGS